MAKPDVDWLIPGNLRLERGPNNLRRLHVQTERAVAHIYLAGAHVARFAPRIATEEADPALNGVLFLSTSSHFAEGKAIRGGVPVIFPWFGPRDGKPGAPMHGFARTSLWQLETSRFDPAGFVEIVLRLESSAATLAAWPHSFVLRHIIRVDATLTMSLQVENNGPEPFTFEEALHTYLAVADVRNVTVDGLQGCDYLDKTDGGARKHEASSRIRFEGETDRVYLNTQGRCTVNDAEGKRCLVVDKSSSATTVVWNPWSAKAAALADLGNDEWPHFVCIETANAAENRITLAPGKMHMMTATIMCRSGADV